MWSGESFAYEGKYFHVKESQFLPKPMQSPRIPVWVAGYWPHKAPYRRMARWDGMVPLLSADSKDELKDLRKATRFTLSLRDEKQPFDAAYSIPPEKAAADAEAYAEIGMTWLLVQLYPTHFGADWQEDWPVEEMRKFLEKGPPA